MDPAICFNKSLASFDATDMCDDLCAFLPLSLMHLNAQSLAPELTFVERVANPAAFGDVSPERALKVLVYRLST